MPRARTLLIVSQVYVPDPASVGQHMADVAAEMVRRGWRVVVLTSREGYEDPAVRYPAYEVRDGVEIIRLPWCSFGKSSIAVRLLAGLSFVAQAIRRSRSLGPIDVVLVSTSPPIAAVAALAIRRRTWAAIKYWVMDLNPDQMVALGRVRPGAPSVRVFDWLNRRILSRAADVIVLDRFMADRINAKYDVSQKLAIIPPWPLDSYLAPVAHEQNPFRREHELNGRFVVMYSGNHSPSNPIDTLLATARAFRDDRRIVFAFVGGGSDKAKVEQENLPNVLSLPYQPLAYLKYSLSAADVHVVTMGNAVVGIVHPCKVYGALAVARPVLAFSPPECHIGDLLESHEIGWHVRHGDVEGAVLAVRGAIATSPQVLAAMGDRGMSLIRGGLGREALCGRFCDVLERQPGATVN